MENGIQGIRADQVNYEKASISELAIAISLDWKNVNYAAKPYLDAMGDLESVKDHYGADTGYSIVAYFLANASTYRGPVAKEIKKELNKRLKS